MNMMITRQYTIVLAGILLLSLSCSSRSAAVAQHTEVLRGPLLQEEAWSIPSSTITKRSLHSIIEAAPIVGGGLEEKKYNNIPITSSGQQHRNLEYECCLTTSSSALVGEVVCATQRVAECCQVCEPTRQAELATDHGAEAKTDAADHGAADHGAADHGHSDNATGAAHGGSDHGTTTTTDAHGTDGHATGGGGGHATNTSTSAAAAHGGTGHGAGGGHGNATAGGHGAAGAHGTGGKYDIFETHADQAHHHEPGHACLFPSIILTLGLVVYLLISRYAHFMPYTAVMFLIGMGIGIGVEKLTTEDDHFAVTSKMWASIDSEVLLLVFLPGLIFKDAFGMNVHLFRVGFFQCLNFAFPMVLIGTFITAAIAEHLFPYGWSWNLCMTFGAILSATDPVAVAALLEEVGAPPRLKVHIGGEALLNDGAAIVFFFIFAQRFFFEVNVDGFGEDIDWARGFELFFRMSLGGACIGFAFGLGFLLMLYQLGRRFSREENIVEVMSTLAIAYLGYYVAEVVCKTSGVIATVACACTVKSFGKAMINDAKLLDDFWCLLEHILNTLLFALGGVVWGVVLASDIFKAEDWGYLFVLYLLLTGVRAFNFFLFYPVTSRIGLKTNLKETIFQIYGGLRGAVGIALAIALDSAVRKAAGDNSEAAQQTAKVFGMIGGMAFLTLCINGVTAGPFLIKLGLTDSTESRKTLVETCKSGYQKHMAAEFVRLLSQHRFRNVNFGLVRAHVSVLKDLTTFELVEAIEDVKDTTATADYRPPELGGVIPYLSNGKTDQMLQEAVKGIQAQMASRNQQDMNVSSHGGGLTRGRSGGIHRRRSSHLTNAATSEPLSIQEMRLLFISLIKAEYETQLDSGELADETLQAIALEESLEFAHEECMNGGIIDDWKFVKMFDSKALTAIKIWKNSFSVCLGASKRGVQATFKKQRIERAMNFMSAHESAEEFIQQEFVQAGDAEVSQAAKIVIKESKAQWKQADAVLKEYQREDIEFVTSLKFCAILLTSGIQYITKLVDRGFLKDDEAEHWAHHIEHELEMVQNVSTEDLISNYPGYIQVAYIDPTLRGDDLDLAMIEEEPTNFSESIKAVQKDFFDDEDVRTEDNSSGSMQQNNLPSPPSMYNGTSGSVDPNLGNTYQPASQPASNYRNISQRVSPNPQNVYQDTAQSVPPPPQNYNPASETRPPNYLNSNMQTSRNTQPTQPDPYNSTSSSRHPNPPNTDTSRNRHASAPPSHAYNTSSSRHPNPQNMDTSRNRHASAPPSNAYNTSSSRRPSPQNAHKDRSTSELRRLCRDNGIDTYGMVEKEQLVDALVRNGILGEPQDVGFYNMIDGMDMRSERSDAGVLGEKYRGDKYPDVVVRKDKYSSSRKGTGGYSYAEEPRGAGGRHSPDSPAVWEEWYDPTQRRHYYVDPATGTTTWTKPTGPRASIVKRSETDEQPQPSRRQRGGAASRRPLPAGWEEHFDPAHQKTYYVNTVSGITQWERPR